MEEPALRLVTDRLVVRSWTRSDDADFAMLNADPVVMKDMGGPISRAKSDSKLRRYMDAFEAFGFGRLAVERQSGEAKPEFLGYVGVMPVRFDHPLGDHEEVGWRLHRSAWGHGFATEAARAVLDDVFNRVGLDEVLSYTSPDNLRSQAVMDRLGLRRDESRDFDAGYDDVGSWRGLVWVANKS